MDSLSATPKTSEYIFLPIVSFFFSLECRWNHYIIISGSRSKVEKTMKNSVFSNFDCDPDIMLK